MIDPERTTSLICLLGCLGASYIEVEKLLLLFRQPGRQNGAGGGGVWNKALNKLQGC